MTDTIQMRAIAERRKAIKEERTAYGEKIAALDNEDAELEIAARVLQRLGVADDGPSLPLQFGHSNGAGRPTVPQMITDAISDFTRAGAPGATGAQVLNALRARIGEIEPNQVRPTLWRMVQDGRLVKERSLYSFPDEAEE